jgi:hypothetical protein
MFTHFFNILPGEKFLLFVDGRFIKLEKLDDKTGAEINTNFRIAIGPFELVKPL